MYGVEFNGGAGWVHLSGRTFRTRREAGAYAREERRYIDPGGQKGYRFRVVRTTRREWNEWWPGESDYVRDGRRG